VQPKASSGGSARAHHPSVPALLGGAQLAPSQLRARADAEQLGDFIKMLANAEYWIGFDLASFEPWLNKCPSPLRELGVAVLLKYGEDIGGRLGQRDIERAQEGLQSTLPSDLDEGVQRGLLSLKRAVQARDRAPGLLQDGFHTSQRNAGMAAHALRAMGSASIWIQGVGAKDRAPQLEVGAPILMRASDERGRALSPLEIDSAMSAEVLIRDEEQARTVVFLVPGEYQVRVPSKASGARKLLLR